MRHGCVHSRICRCRTCCCMHHSPAGPETIAGYAEPDWNDYRPGNASDLVIVPTTDQIWGDIAPGGEGTYCKWQNGTENNGRGTCRTDISWIHSSIGLSKKLLTDPVVNYFLRFYIEGACYRSTQVCPSSCYSSCPLAMQFTRVAHSRIVLLLDCL